MPLDTSNTEDQTTVMPPVSPNGPKASATNAQPAMGATTVIPPLSALHEDAGVETIDTQAAETTGVIEASAESMGVVDSAAAPIDSNAPQQGLADDAMSAIDKLDPGATVVTAPAEDLDAREETAGDESVNSNEPADPQATALMQSMANIPDPSADETQLQQQPIVLSPDTPFETIKASDTAAFPKAIDHDLAEKHQKEKKRRGIAGKLVALLLVGGLAGGYAYGTQYFGDHVYPNTTIAGVNIAGKTKDEAVNAINQNWSNYALEVSGDGISWTYRTDSSASIVDAQKLVDQTIANQNSLTWPLGLFNAATGKISAGSTTENATPDLSQELDTSLLSDAFDVQSFEQSLGDAVDAANEGRTGEFNTQTAYDEATGQYSLDKAKEGKRYNKDNIIKYAEIMVTQLASKADLSNLGDQLFEPIAGGTSEDVLQAACDNANAMLSTNVTFKFDDITAATLDRSTIQPWIGFDENYNAVLNEDAVNEYAANLAKGFNTVGTTRTYTRADGKVCTVSGGTWGWSVDTDATVQSVKDAINNHTQGDVQLSYTSKGDVYNGAGERDWGAYIDVDLSSQYARYYDASGNILWESGTITGNPSTDHDTPQGVYFIRSNSGGMTLVSPDIDPTTGEPEYRTEVTYWMPFVGNMIGFHDADWQASSNFGNPSAIYSVGSHGCVNLPPAKAQSLQSMIYVGLCVVVHY